MARIRTNNVFGTTTNNPLTSGATTLNSAGLANLAAVSGSDHAVITLDPRRVHGAPEIVHVTAHTGSAISATIFRAREGTTARQHPAGTEWVHGWTVNDAGLGIVALASTTTDQAGIGAGPTDLTSLTVTFTPLVNRVYVFTGYLPQCAISDATTTFVVDLYKDGVSVQRWIGGRKNTADSFTVNLQAFEVSPTAVPHTYKMVAQRVAGTGTLLVNLDTNRPAYLLVEDAGAA